MSTHDFNIDNLSDSAAIANAFSNSLIPPSGVAIRATTTAARGYADQTLVSTDLVSSAAGKELLASNIYSNMFNLNMTRESLTSLSRSILSSGSIQIQEDGTKYTRIKCRTKNGNWWNSWQKICGRNNTCY